MWSSAGNAARTRVVPRSDGRQAAVWRTGPHASNPRQRPRFLPPDTYGPFDESRCGAVGGGALAGHSPGLVDLGGSTRWGSAATSAADLATSSSFRVDASSVIVLATMAAAAASEACCGAGDSARPSRHSSGSAPAQERCTGRLGRTDQGARRWRPPMRRPPPVETCCSGQRSPDSQPSGGQLCVDEFTIRVHAGQGSAIPVGSLDVERKIHRGTLGQQLRQALRRLGTQTPNRTVRGPPSPGRRH